MSLRQRLDNLKGSKPSIVPLDMTAEWGETVHVRSLSVGQIKIFQKSFEADTNESVLAMVCLGLCEENGDQVYRYPEDLAELSKFNMVDMGKICEAINRINGVIEDEKKD